MPGEDARGQVGHVIGRVGDWVEGKRRGEGSDGAMWLWMGGRVRGGWCLEGSTGRTGGSENARELCFTNTYY